MLVPGKSGEVVVWAQNLGDTGTSGRVTITDALPAGLRAIGITAVAGGTGADARGPVKCSAAKLTCEYGVFEENGSHEVIENPEGKGVESLPPYEMIEMKVKVEVKTGAATGANAVTVSGGGANAQKSAESTIQVGKTPAKFGFEDFSLVPEKEGGLFDTQAGSHPFQLTTTVSFNNEGLDNGKRPRAIGLAKNVVTQLPPGLIGNPTPFAQCTDAQFANAPEVKTEFIVNECPAASAVGVATAQFTDPEGEYKEATAPVFNVTPLHGEPARLGFKIAGIVSTFLDVSIRTGGDYGVTVTAENIPELASVLSVRVTVWGVPGAASHDPSRGWECMYHFGLCPVSTANNPPPFLVMPSSCERPFAASIGANSWPAEGRPSVVASDLAYQLPEALDGCNRLPFAPELRVTPDGNAASSPSGLNVDVHVPQSAILNSESLADSAVRGISVTLPEGMSVNPSGADGLEACSEGEVGYLSETSSPPSELFFTPTLGTPFCPDASKVGTVKIKVPILANPLEGAVYLGAQNANPFGSLLALYIVAQDPVSGVLVKLAGETRLSPTGQLTGVFENSPEAPFEDAELHFFGGERAPLATPALCGSYTSAARFTPWSGTEPADASSTFDITSGPNHTPCPAATLPFSPSLTGGTLNIQAGAFSDLSTTISREDGQQDLQVVQLHMPPGVSGLLTSVKLCPDQRANEGTCGPESLIGETTVAAGVGSDPVTVKGGKVYLTEKYKGAPFGLSIVNPVKTGPFDLEHDTSNPSQTPACDCLVVRATIQVDPHTAALTVTTDSEGPHAIPHLIDGIPVQIRKVNVLINRPNFSFNPTNCSPLAITGSLLSTKGASAALSVPFQVTNCALLKFAPKFAVSTSGRPSKALGASLSVKLSYPKAPFGSQANIASVKVSLPKQLPSRLTTLQKACLAVVFESNPANCPAASIVGHAKATTPLLPVPLTGPAYFVSHGSETFPSLVIVLQGYGVTVNLVGSTFIRKGITSSTFKTVPDAPVGTFELTLPQGKYSALAANGNLCTSKLVMPTEFVAQNGAVIHQTTKISTTGCGQGISITKKKPTGNSVAVTVATTVKGVVTITGAGLRKTSKTVAAGSHTLNVPLTAKGRAARKHRRKIKIKAALKVGKKTVSKTASLKL
jgi:hypothetical protein